MNITRRRFGSGAGALLLSTSLPSVSSAQEKADVIVIGAGLSGLNAALLLEEQGFNVIVLEASNRVGGRMHTRMIGGTPTNVGGTTIGPLYARIRDTAERLGIGIIAPSGPAQMASYINGTLVSQKDWANSDANKTQGDERGIQPAFMEFSLFSKHNPLEDIEAWMSPDHAQLDIPITTYLRSQGVSDEAIRLLGVSANVFDVSSTSALTVMRDIKRLQLSMQASERPADTNRGTYDSSGNTAAGEIEGGSEELPKAIAEKLQKEVRLNQVVARIDMTGNQVEITTVGGNRYSSTFAVSAIPFFALKNVVVRPAFQGGQALAVNEPQYAAVTQVFMKVKEPFWEEDGLEPGLFTDTALERVFALRNSGGEIDMLDCWTNGIGAVQLDQLPADEVGPFVVKMINRIRPSTEGKIEFADLYSWGRNPFVGGNRHVYAAGQVTQCAGVMAKPWQKLHIAGEHTRTVEQGMEAAMESGERAAFEIIERA